MLQSRFDPSAIALLIGVGLFVTTTAHAQSGGFSQQQVISTDADRAFDVHAADLDGDGDPDAVAALDGELAWYENLGGGLFGAGVVLASDAPGAKDVHTADLDGDGDLDLISASESDDKVAWYENLGGGQFGPTRVLSSSAVSVQSVDAADLDGDGRLDVLTGALSVNGVAWHRNLGAGVFAPEAVIASSGFVVSVASADLDGDGDVDVLSASPFGGKAIAWYENFGGGQFGPERLVNAENQFLRSIVTADLDGDGDQDVLSASSSDHAVAWCENLGGGTFGPRIVLSNNVVAPWDVCVGDVDLDGDLDVAAIGNGGFDKVAWFENLGGGSFSPFIVIEPENSPAVLGGSGIFAADADGDGDADLFTSSVLDDKIAWYANEVPTATSFGVGCGSPALGFAADSSAVLNGQASATVSNVLDATFVMLGVSDELSSFGPLPLDLGVVGFTGCGLLQSFELFGLPTQPSSTPGSAAWSFGVPNSTSLAGVHLFGQAFSVGLSSFEVTFSNGVDWQVGR